MGVDAGKVDFIYQSDKPDRVVTMCLKECVPHSESGETHKRTDFLIEQGACNLGTLTKFKDFNHDLMTQFKFQLEQNAYLQSISLKGGLSITKTADETPRVNENPVGV